MRSLIGSAWLPCLLVGGLGVIACGGLVASESALEAGAGGSGRGASGSSNGAGDPSEASLGTPEPNAGLDAASSDAGSFQCQTDCADASTPTGCIQGAVCTPNSGCGGGTPGGCTTSCFCDLTDHLQCTTNCPLVDAAVVVGMDARSDWGVPMPVTNRCTDLVAGGHPVSPQNQAGPAPNLGLGGAIVDGVYDEVAFTYFHMPSPSGGTDRATIRISGGGTKLEYISDGVPLGLVMTLSPSGASLNDAVICPPNDINMFVGPYYTATPGQFVGMSPNYSKVFLQRH